MREITGVPVAPVLVSVKPGSQETRPACGGHFLTPSCLQSGHQRDAHILIAAEGRRVSLYINSDRVSLFLNHMVGALQSQRKDPEVAEHEGFYTIQNAGLF